MSLKRARREMRRVALPLGTLCLSLLASCSDSPSAPGTIDEPAAPASWSTWVLPDAAALRPGPPPPAGSVEAQEEIEAIVSLQADPTASELEEIRRWEGSPTSPWTHEAIDILERYWYLLPDVRTASPARSARIMALLHVAMYDAVVASWDAKFAYERPSPAEVDGRIRRRLADEGVPSYPSEHAAAAAAAAEILKYAFPIEDAGRFDDLARRAGEARIAAGVAFPSDVEAGAALGREVAARVLAHARSDGSDQVSGDDLPTGEHAWRPTAPRYIEEPFDPLAGQWSTWVLPSGDAYRPPPPPALSSARFEEDMEELRMLPVRRTLDQANAARYWATDSPSAWWELYAEEEIERRGLSGPRAARAHAIISVTMYDAFVACWDAKYHYSLLRPISVDSTLSTSFSTPPFPSYPSGHSTMSAAAAEAFAYLFPDRAEHYHARALEASNSRVWGGVHYRFDVEVGDSIGALIGAAVVQHAREMGG